jgi:hypothetical protein
MPVVGWIGVGIGGALFFLCFVGLTISWGLVHFLSYPKRFTGELTHRVDEEKGLLVGTEVLERTSVAKPGIRKRQTWQRSMPRRKRRMSR